MEAFTVDVILTLDADIDVDRTPGSATITILDNDSQLQGIIPFHPEIYNPHTPFCMLACFSLTLSNRIA